MLCGFERDNVFVEQEGWSELSNVKSMSVTDANVVHTVESNRWTFKERPCKKDLVQAVKGFLLYHVRLFCTLIIDSTA